jgi:hypothetical protein
MSREYGVPPEGWSTELRLQSCGMTSSEAYDHRTAQVVALVTALDKARRQLAELIPVPSDPEMKEWPCENPADRECLHEVYSGIRTAIDEAFP